MDKLAFKDIGANVRHGLELLRLLNFDAGAALGPIRLDISPAAACNFRCGFCDSHSYLKEAHVKPEMLSQAVLNDLLRDLKQLRVRELLFSGNGEPLLSPHLVPAIHRHGADFNIEILSNGGTLDQVDAALFSRIARLTVSLNSGSGAAHQAVHGYRGENLFGQITAQISRILEFPGASDKLRLNYVLNRQNYTEFEDFIRLARDWDVAFMARQVSVDFPELIPWELDWEMRREVALTAARYLGQRQLSRRLELSLQLVQRALGLSFAGSDPQRRLYPCYNAYIQAYVAANGDVLVCPAAGEVPLGNLYREGFKEIWQRASSRRLRLLATQMHATGKPVCGSCFDCPNVQYHSVAFHNVYRRIPFLAAALARRARRMAAAS